MHTKIEIPFKHQETQNIDKNDEIIQKNVETNQIQETQQIIDNSPTINWIDDEDPLKENKENKQEIDVPCFTEEMDSLEIPRFLQKSFLFGKPNPPISSLRDWQKQLFSSKEWKEKRNILIRIPTAGGKTVAADVAIAQTLSIDSNAKILYLVPFVALASEKFTYFSSRFPDFNVRGFYQNVGGAEFMRGTIGVCTYERGHSLINSAIKKNYFDDFKLVIIDEIHMMGDDHRGATVESIILKCMISEHQPRILGLSATISDNDKEIFEKFLNCFVFAYEKTENGEKHTNVKQYVKTYDNKLCIIENGEINYDTEQKIESIDQDKKSILPLVIDALNDKGNVIYFVNTKKEAEISSLFLANHISKENNKLLLAKRRELCNQLHQKRKERFASSIAQFNSEEKESKAIYFMISNGICYHHAGLLLDERKIIEKGFREGLLNVLVATTTLSAGLNFSTVSLVIIDNVFRTIYVNGMNQLQRLSTAQYIQMAGRAGRTDHKQGKVIIIQNTKTTNEIDYIKKLSLQHLEKIETHLLDESEFDKFLLQLICFMPNIVQSKHLETIALKTYQFIQNQAENDEEKAKIITEASICRLKKLNLINDNKKATQIGLGLSAANMSIKDGLTTYKSLQKMDNSLNLADTIHLMILCIPEDCDENYPFPPYSNHIWTEIYGKHRDVMEQNYEIPFDTFERVSIQTMLYGKMKKKAANEEENETDCFDYDHILKKMYCASVLVDMIEGNSIYFIEEKYQFSRGHLENLQNQTLTFCNQIIRLCSVCNFILLENVLKSFRRSIIHCVNSELLPLMSIPQCTQSIARKLFNVGLMTPNDVLLLNINEIANILQYGTTKNQQLQTKDSVDDHQLTEENLEIAELIRKGADLLCAREIQLEEISSSL